MLLPAAYFYHRVTRRIAHPLQPALTDAVRGTGATEDGNDPSIGGNFLTESQPNTEGGANGGQQLDGAAESDAPRPPGDFVVYANMACADSSFWSVEHTGAYAFPWQCRRHCANHPACRAYTWDASASRCSLASSCEKRVVAEGATSGVDAPTGTSIRPAHRKRSFGGAWLSVFQNLIPRISWPNCMIDASFAILRR